MVETCCGGLGLMLAQIRQAVLAILPKLFDDEDLAKDVTYRVFKGTSFDSEKGYNIEQWAEYNVKVIPLNTVMGGRKVSPVAFGALTTPMQTGNTLFMFRTADLPESCSVRDTIVCDSIVYNIVRITPIFGLITQMEVVSNA